jgi:hypothetical protein
MSRKISPGAAIGVMLSGKSVRCESIGGGDQDENPGVGSMSPHLYKEREGGPGTNIPIANGWRKCYVVVAGSS